MEAIAQYFAEHPQVRIQAVYCNNPKAGVIARAERLGIPLRVFDREEYRSGMVLEELKAMPCDLIVLAGFLWLIPADWVATFPQRILNLHPALLPKFGGKGMYGHHVHEAVIAQGERESGISIHWVNEHYDEGAMVFQAKYSIGPEDTPESIAKKGQALEHEHFPKVIAGLLFPPA